MSTKLTPYLELIRWYQPAGTLLLMWPPLWCLFLVSDGIPTIEMLLAFVLGAFFMRSAGCVINDITDRKLDAKVERTKNRPLASGAISLKQAVTTLLLLLLSALAVAIYLGWNVVIAAMFVVPLVIAYPWMKRITFWPQLFLGITFNYGVLLASIAVTGSIQPLAWWLYAAAVFWTLGYDTIYGFQDIKDDEQVGVKSTSRLFKNHPKLFHAVCFMLAIYLFKRSLDLSGMPTFYLLESLHILAGMIVFHFIWQVYRLDITQPKLCMKLFKQNAFIIGPAVLAFTYGWTA